MSRYPIPDRRRTVRQSRPLARLLLGFIAAAWVLPAVACGDDDDSRVLTVFAPESLSAAFEALGEAFEEANPGVDLRFTFAGAAEIATLLGEGAAADLVTAEDAVAMRGLLDAGLIQAPVDITTDALVVAMREGLADFDSLEDLARDGMRIAIGAADVPAGRYAREALEKGAAEYGDNWQGTVLDNVVGEETSAGAVLERVRSGEADTGFVYRSSLTDVARAAAIGLLPLPVRVGVAVVYPAALTTAPVELVLARAFLDFVLSGEGQSILESFGFGDNQ